VGLSELTRRPWLPHRLAAELQEVVKGVAGQTGIGRHRHRAVRDRARIRSEVRVEQGAGGEPAGDTSGIAAATWTAAVRATTASIVVVTTGSTPASRARLARRQRSVRPSERHRFQDDGVGGVGIEDRIEPAGRERLVEGDRDRGSRSVSVSTPLPTVLRAAARRGRRPAAAVRGTRGRAVQVARPPPGRSPGPTHRCVGSGETSPPTARRTARRRSMSASRPRAPTFTFRQSNPFSTAFSAAATVSSESTSPIVALTGTVSVGAGRFSFSARRSASDCPASRAVASASASARPWRAAGVSVGSSRSSASVASAFPSFSSSAPKRSAASQADRDSVQPGSGVASPRPGAEPTRRRLRGRRRREILAPIDGAARRFEGTRQREREGRSRIGSDREPDGERDRVRREELPGRFERRIERVPGGLCQHGSGDAGREREGREREERGEPVPLGEKPQRVRYASASSARYCPARTGSRTGPRGCACPSPRPPSSRGRC